MKKVKVLVFDVDPENGSGELLQKLLATNAALLQVKLIAEGRIARVSKRLSSALSSFSPDLVFLSSGSWTQALIAELFPLCRKGNQARPVIAVVNTGDRDDVGRALVYGANDFLIPPFRPLDVLPRVWRWFEATREEDAALHKLKDELGLGHIVGEDPAFLTEIKKLPVYARLEAHVLILGETGTGKEIAARAIQLLSPRASKPFVALNCAAIPENLLENVLFGHLAGSYTGAITTTLGLFREADGGVLFLDEINSLSLLMQGKLLRVLQDKEVRPVGSDKIFKVDVRIIATSNTNLAEAVKSGRFRQDLFYRLNILTLTLPPLRQRPGDVPLLARFFLAKFTTEVGKPARSLTPAAMQRLVLYEWPGNVRELENVVQRTLALSEQACIEGSEILFEAPLAAAAAAAVATGNDTLQAVKAFKVAEVERKYILEKLAALEGNVTKVAQAAGTDRRTMQRLIGSHNIDTEPYSPRPSPRATGS